MIREGQQLTARHSYVTLIPDQLESADAAPMLCAGVTVYGTCNWFKYWPRGGLLIWSTLKAALRRSGAKSGQWVVIAGAGGGLGTFF